MKTEILFIERCLALLKPGGRMGIVLPEGIFNNPSLAYVREFCEDRARVLAVVSLPQETFYSSGASVKASLLFLKKFTEEEAADFAAKRDKVTGRSRSQVCRRNRGGNGPPASGGRSGEGRKGCATPGRRRKANLRDYLKQLEDTKTREVRALSKERFDYPIFLLRSGESRHHGHGRTGRQRALSQRQYAKRNETGRDLFGGLSAVRGHPEGIHRGESSWMKNDFPPRSFPVGKCLSTAMGQLTSRSAWTAKPFGLPRPQWRNCSRPRRRT